MKQHYKAIIIGSGQGGTPLAKKLAMQGWQTALIEKHFVGGTCINTGCTPTKAMIASAQMSYKISRSKEFGLITNGLKIDIQQVLDRKNKIVESFRSSSRKGLEETENLDLIFGEASFINNKKLTIKLNGNEGSKEVTGDYIFIDTGTRPTIPEIDGLHDAGYFTSTTIMEYNEVPEHLLIIGGGYIGLEFGQMYRRFGSKVTILEHGDRFLSREDEDIADEIKKILEAEEIKIYTGSQLKKVKGKAGNLEALISMQNDEKSISCTHILLSAGRTPNTDNLNLSATNVETDSKGYIKVNEKLETSASGIYAIGDVKGGPEFTHISYNDYVILYHNLLNNENRNINGRPIPYCMFTDPQLGRVGISEQEAKEKGLNFKVVKLPMENVARAIETGDTRGMMKAIVNADDGTILGVAILGQQGGETMTLLQMAMMGNITATQLQEVIIAHPLYAESINNLFMKLK